MADEIQHPTAEQRHKDFIESQKTGYDFFKHLTTLSTASLVLLSTLLEKFFRAPSWRVLIGVAFLGFFVSLVSCLVAMLTALLSMKASGQDEGASTLGRIGVAASLGGFLIAIIALVAFTLRNFYQ
ncbi:hypothetical protein RQP53_11990 [Paucibacter sp. APW11]|uniref:Uncharacterized protein n=1 Tax=Roseateles aquae TaxID=3077235 RepID=A0ABU3PDM6_9BURK|nr:hypothetical protein [Paucibacter sp. APW11]MDT8999986.1 hypothetical protein [Paucibacter sp. APW11]